MSELRFTEDHEWLRIEADGTVTVGVTAFAQQALGDVVFVQVPELGSFKAGAEVSVLESVKAASTIGMPLAGDIVEANSKLIDTPELVNEDPFGEGWFFRFQPADPAALARMLDQVAYNQLIQDQADE
ncbi:MULTISPECIES: glycine cleavage system protein GcvH [Pseudomonas]|jgi:glycine cleavage system H protein|uniref:glycine cleavage system protein GcvH n=1 Tax=Pseudomonas TaxID=286 RepID=UPI000E005813|nr:MULTISPECIES: glycine cleavage system protein GcvH [unclassified Pseudomonas]MBV7573252.1 glycine cleavage system protein GcvH [Pseudomonas sp. PDM32]NWB21842.1 glycine cleavage system protein GcvH [Pseudomonas sp. D4002]NWB63949.1 glycine cleavage system protein GcvH [Pseudomonas sp. F1002]